MGPPCWGVPQEGLTDPEKDAQEPRLQETREYSGLRDAPAPAPATVGLPSHATLNEHCLAEPSQSSAPVEMSGGYCLKPQFEGVLLHTDNPKQIF